MFRVRPALAVSLLVVLAASSTSAGGGAASAPPRTERCSLTFDTGEAWTLERLRGALGSGNYLACPRTTSSVTVYIFSDVNGVCRDGLADAQVKPVHDAKAFYAGLRDCFDLSAHPAPGTTRTFLARIPSVDLGAITDGTKPYQVDAQVRAALRESGVPVSYYTRSAGLFCAETTNVEAVRAFIRTAGAPYGTIEEQVADGVGCDELAQQRFGRDLPKVVGYLIP